MPIVVQHQPSLTKLGNLAYRTGQQQYADRRRQEEEARLMKERQMAIQQQQFGDKMAFDVWNREYGQAGAMQQLMIQNEQQAQRDQRQQGFAMDRIGVGHQNNLALDDINNMQQQQRDERLRIERDELAKQRGEAAVQEEIRRQDQARDNEARQVQQRIETAEVNRRFSNLNGNGRQALAEELATQTELRINQSEMSPEDFEGAWAESQERQAAIESDINNTRALEGEVGFKSPVPDRPNWSRVEQGEGKDPTYQFNFEEAYPGLPDHASRLEQFQKDFGPESEDGRRVFEPSLTDPNGGEWVDKPDLVAEQVANYNAEIAIPKARLDQEQAHVTDLFKRRTEIEKSEAYLGASDASRMAMVADVNADIDSARESISKQRDELDRIHAQYTGGQGDAAGAAAAAAAAAVGGAAAELPPPIVPEEEVVPEVVPEEEAPLPPAPELGDPVPAGQGQGQVGGMIAPPAPNDATAEMGSENNPIITRTPEDAMKLDEGQFYMAPADGNGNPIVLQEGENPPEWIRMEKLPEQPPPPEPEPAPFLEGVAVDRVAAVEADPLSQIEKAGIRLPEDRAAELANDPIWKENELELAKNPHSGGNLYARAVRLFKDADKDVRTDLAAKDYEALREMFLKASRDKRASPGLPHTPDEWAYWEGPGMGDSVGTPHIAAIEAVVAEQFRAEKSPGGRRSKEHIQNLRYIISQMPPGDPGQSDVHTRGTYYFTASTDAGDFVRAKGEYDEWILAYKRGNGLPIDTDPRTIRNPPLITPEYIEDMSFKAEYQKGIGREEYRKSENFVSDTLRFMELMKGRGRKGNHLPALPGPDWGSNMLQLELPLKLQGMSDAEAKNWWKENLSTGGR